MTNDEFAQCKHCARTMDGVLDQRLREYCDTCCDDMKIDAGLVKVPLQEIVKVREPANKE